jgi:hypothetical protein
MVADAMNKEHRMARAPRYVGVGFIRPEVVSSGRWDIREEVSLLPKEAVRRPGRSRVVVGDEGAVPRPVCAIISFFHNPGRARAYKRTS